MTYKEAFEQLEYLVVARLDLMSVRQKDEFSEFNRKQIVHTLELTLRQIQELDKQITKLQVIK